MSKSLIYPEKLHEPVLLQEVLEALRVTDSARLKKVKFIDATIGLGGHTIEIVKLGGTVLGIEADNETLKLADKRIKEACPILESEYHFQGSFILVHGNFKDLTQIALTAGFATVDGILFDLGVSNLQLTDSGRGFSFQNPDAELDMRIDVEMQGVSAADILQILSKVQLRQLFSKVLTFNETNKLTDLILSERRLKPIRSVGDFLGIINKSILGKKGLNRATLPFLALRIAVNSELENLSQALPQAFDLLGERGRLVVISFHSGEDAIVKDFFRLKQKEGDAKLITVKPIVPGEKEVLANPRARSAKMRVLERIS